MNSCRKVVYAVATSVSLMSVAFAQTSPQPDTTSPSAASSPSQRDATSNRTPEAPAANGANPSAASSPHQQQATQKSEAKQTMKGCMAREQADHTGMSKADARKSCKEQLKAAPQK
jgi:hypothetical protein